MHGVTSARTLARATSRSLAAGRAGRRDEPVEVVALGLPELEGVREPVEDPVGDAADVSALEAGVVLDADPGEDRHLLAAQPRDPAMGTVCR